MTCRSRLVPSTRVRATQSLSGRGSSFSGGARQLHRVLPVPGRDRYSIVYFSMPRHDALIAPAPALYDGVPEYRAFAWTEFISGRLGDNFADYGVDDIQISDFRIG